MSRIYMYLELVKRRGMEHIRMVYFVKRNLGEEVFAYTIPHDALHFSPLLIPHFFQFVVFLQVMMVYDPEIADKSNFINYVRIKLKIKSKSI